MIMRFNEIYKFSNGTLQQIDEALDYRVKEFRVNKVNPRLNTRFWTTNDVIKSKQFMFSIQKRLKLRRIFRNLESFVGGRIRESSSQAKHSKAGKLSKKRTLQLRDEFIDERVPATEPRVDDEEAIVQKVLEESMKDAYPAHRGPLPPVVFKEPDFGKLQPLPETPKKRNPAEQFIFQRCTPATTEPSGPVESSSLYAELGLTDSGTELDEEVSPEMNA
ncbi:hypothetical protein Tco_0543176 [Tanacetum coccineum]